MTLQALHTELVGGGPGFALLRISGRWLAAHDARLAPPTLLIADGAAWRRLAVVPGTPPIAAGPAAPSFAIELEVPLHLIVSGGPWWLEPGPTLAIDDERDGLAARLRELTDEVQALRDRVDGVAPRPRLTLHRRTAVG